MPRRCLCIQLGFADLDWHRSASVGLIQTSEASVRQPPSTTGIADREGRTRYRRRLHVQLASRAQRLCCNRDASCVTKLPLQRAIIFHKEIYLSHIEPESVSGGTDIEPWAMASWNLSQVLLTIGAFHGDHRVQTVARIGQVSKRNACIHCEKMEDSPSCVTVHAPCNSFLDLPEQVSKCASLRGLSWHPFHGGPSGSLLEFLQPALFTRVRDETAEVPCETGAWSREGGIFEIVC
jgi:hypothetical protein